MQKYQSNKVANGRQKFCLHSLIIKRKYLTIVFPLLSAPGAYLISKPQGAAVIGGGGQNGEWLILKLEELFL